MNRAEFHPLQAEEIAPLKSAADIAGKRKKS
jgi:hypothetical protein